MIFEDLFECTPESTLEALFQFFEDPILKGDLLENLDSN